MNQPVNSLENPFSCRRSHGPHSAGRRDDLGACRRTLKAELSSFCSKRGDPEAAPVTHTESSAEHIPRSEGSQDPLCPRLPLLAGRVVESRSQEWALVPALWARGPVAGEQALTPTQTAAALQRQSCRLGGDAAKNAEVSHCRSYVLDAALGTGGMPAGGQPPARPRPGLLRTRSPMSWVPSTGPFPSRRRHWVTCAGEQVQVELSGAHDENATASPLPPPGRGEPHFKLWGLLSKAQ